MRRIAAVFIVLLLAAYPASMARGGGEIPGGPTDSSGLLRVPWKVAEHRLANGMRALMLQDRRAPSIVFQVWSGVGRRDEPKGKTGVAHMLEHMMFRGTKKYGPKVVSNIVSTERCCWKCITTPLRIGLKLPPWRHRYRPSHNVPGSLWAHWNIVWGHFQSGVLFMSLRL